jgi:Zn-dependent metalloprotease
MVTPELFRPWRSRQPFSCEGKPSLARRVTRRTSLLVILVLFGACKYQRATENTHRVADASTPVPSVWLPSEQKPSLPYIYYPDSRMTPEAFIERYSASVWNLSDLDELRLFNTIMDGDHAHQFYSQFHAGFPVQGAQLILMLSASGYVLSATHNPIGGLKGIPTKVLVAESDVVKRAHRRAALACSLPEPLALVGEDLAPLLLITQRHRRLVWQKSVIVAKPTWTEWTVEIDASTGELLQEWGGKGINGEMGGCSTT